VQSAEGIEVPPIAKNSQSNGENDTLQGATAPNESEFRQVRRRRHNRQRNSRVNGSGRNDSGGLAAAVLSQRDLDIFVGGCSLDSSADDIAVHCVGKNISVKSVSPLVTRAPWYKAYKVTVAAADREKLLVPEAWPDGYICKKIF